ncbi:MAG: hypothetical protein AVDCRST_MAG73-306 [uncultured Thermomicrobiales bacterium]|uniref:Uncharacterized protein n=1 Tax=uncultured Thermomicrobiales bacterium TaxID=1645740 RepID=A0A6J4TH09_9BACT|nr:MAG: hypothetical protein AVDCRST_MAG73-306 [uncultured Thermomicrobiales bacterium]
MHHADDPEKVVEAQRTTKAEARQQGIGAPEPGAEPSARSYPDETGVADLGVGEPVVSPAVRDDPGPRPSANPTGMLAGETSEDRQEEASVRRALEARFPGTRGHWKEAGRVPGAGDRSDDGT